MLGDERSQPREAEHLACCRVVSLYQPVAVEENALATIEYYLLLLVAHPRHKPKGHPSGPQFLCIATTTAAHIGQVVACVGVGEAPTPRVEDGVEAGDKHVGWYVGDQRVVDPSQYIPRRG